VVCKESVVTHYRFLVTLLEELERALLRTIAAVVNQDEGCKNVTAASFCHSSTHA